MNAGEGPLFSIVVRVVGALLGLSLAPAARGAAAAASIDWQVTDAPVVVVAQALALPGGKTPPSTTNTAEFEVVEHVKGLAGVRTFRLRWFSWDDHPYRAWAARRTPVLLFLQPREAGTCEPVFRTSADWRSSAYPLDGVEPIRNAVTAALEPLTTPTELLAAVRRAAAAKYRERLLYVSLGARGGDALNGPSVLVLPSDAWEAYAMEGLVTSPRPWVRAALVDHIAAMRMQLPGYRGVLTRLLADPHAEPGVGPLGRRVTYPIRHRAWQVLRRWEPSLAAPEVESPTFFRRLGRLVLPPLAVVAGAYGTYRYRTRHRRRALARRRVPVRGRLVRTAIVGTYTTSVLVACAWAPAAWQEYAASLNTGGGRVIEFWADRKRAYVQVLGDPHERVSSFRVGAGAGVPWTPQTVVIVPWAYLWPPLATVVIGHLGFLATVGRRRRRRERMMRRGLCPDCGYDLRGSADRCPECGRAVHAANEWIKLLRTDDSSSPRGLDRA